MSDKALTLSEIHESTMDILKKIISICDELHIDYFMAYGTLIGAVRHQGFIPWDDDLDIIMTRPHYDIFKAYCTEHEAELQPFRLMGPDNTPGYPFAINRFCDTRYRMEAENVPDAGMGMFIDIYPMDAAGNNPEEIRKLDKKKWVWLSMLNTSMEDRFKPSRGGLLRSLVKFPGWCFSRLMGRDHYMGKLLSLAGRYRWEDSRYVACMVWDVPTQMMEKSWFEQTVTLDFEGVPVKVSRDYHQMLTDFYGDYMQLPPEDQRQPHHMYKLYRKDG